MRNKMFRICIFLFIITNLCECSEKSSTTQNFNNILNIHKPKCTENQLQNYEWKMVRLMTFGPNGRPFPDSIEGMKQFCNETSRLSSQAEEFSKECLKPEMHNLVSVFLYSIRSTFIRSYCGNRNIKKNIPYIKIAPCLNKYYFSDYRCFAAFNNQTRMLVNHKEDNIKIPFTCCNFNELLDCLGELLDAHSCTAKYRDEFVDVIKRATAGLADLVCSEYTEATDRCESLGPAPSAPNAKQYNSFILALVDLIGSMKSFNTDQL